MSARDDDVDFIRSCFSRPANFCHALGKRRQAGGKSGGDGGNRNAAAFQGMQRGLDERVIHANCAYLDAEFFDAEFL